MTEEESLILFSDRYFLPPDGHWRVGARRGGRGSAETGGLFAEPSGGLPAIGGFSSGGRGGVILLNKAERVRLFTGDSVEGWQLDRTQRSAYFSDAAGGVATLELAVASTLPMPMMVPSGVTGAGVNSAADANSNEDAPPAYDGPVTFESIANRQKQEMEAKAKSRNP